MKKISSLLLVVIILFIITSCQKEEIVKTTNLKSDIVKLDKPISINGMLFNQYVNNSTGQILYEESESNNSTKAELTYDKAVKETIVNGRSYYSCDNAGKNCYVGMATDGSGDKYIIIKKGAIPTN